MILSKSEGFLLYLDTPVETTKEQIFQQLFLFPTSLKISALSEETPKKEFEAIFFTAAADFYSILFKTAQTSFLIVFLRRVDDLPGLQQRPLVPLDVERQAEQHGENHAALK